MEFVASIFRAAGCIALPMFFQPRKYVGICWLLHALLITAITGGVGYLHYKSGWANLVETGPKEIRDYWSPLLFLLCYLLLWFGWWILRLFQSDPEASLYPDIDACWNEILGALSKAGIGLGDTPVYLVVGRFQGDEASLFRHGSTLVIDGAPGAGAPLRAYAHREAVYVTCVGASLSGRQAALLEGPGSAGASTGGGDYTGVDVDKSIGMSMAGAAGGGDGANPLADVQQVIRRAREENRSLTSEEHRVIRELTGMGGQDATRGPVVRSSHPSVLKDAGEADEHAARLRYACRLLARARHPLCPLNGVVQLVTLNATDTDDDAQQMGLVLQRDLVAIREATRLHFPVFTMVGDLQRLNGAQEFLSQFPADKLKQRLGKSFPLVPDVPPETVTGTIESSVRWVFDALVPFWVFKLFRVESYSVPLAHVVAGNAQLFHFLNDLRERSARLSRLIARAAVVSLDAPPLFGGCYLAGMDQGNGPAFVPGFFKRLDETQGFVAWTGDAFGDDASYRSRTMLGYAAVGVCALTVAALAIWVMASRARP